MSPGKDTTAASPPPGCPMHQAQNPAPKPKPPPGCPMHRKEDGDNLNPDNNIPNLAQSPFPDQDIPLPTERVISSIPRAKSDDESKWEYPSPQQFYNALRRKGWETPETAIETMLLRFQGRPSELSPKARIMSFFGAPKPFDRHDWIVDRCGKEVRYVIDYYGGEDDVANDVPVFHLDVRPALDSVESTMDRLKFGVREAFARFKGGAESSTTRAA
ncbi:holocytochrome c synthase [Gamsiella multidivaricata]|nr:holocytochrome c synthase [Gamsiella multidivaricata]